MSHNNHFDTLSIHAGQVIDKTGCCTNPLYQCTSFVFNDTAHAVGLFNLQAEGHIYTRLSNPTTDVFEKRIAALEGGTAAVATSSGQSAHLLAFQNIAQAGDNIICSSSLYGGSYNLFNTTFRSLGIDFRIVKGRKPEDYEQFIDSRTKAIFVETIGNSDFYIPDFDALAEVAKRHNIPFVIDNTFGGAGYVFRPLEHGCNVITHAATKWIGGHGNSIAGIVVDGGNFNWDNGNFPQFTEPCDSYHGLKFYETFGNSAFAVRARAMGLRDLGCCLSPFNAMLLLTGVETLSLRMQRGMDNSLELAQWLSSHPKVVSVKYPGLKTDSEHANAVRYLKNGFGGVLCFTVKGDRAATAKCVEKLELILHLTNVGDNKTTITHPASTTHSQLSDAALAAAGIGQGTLRLSVGIENVEDIKSDIDQALRQL